MAQHQKTAPPLRTTGARRSVFLWRLVLLASALALTAMAGGRLWAVGRELPQEKLKRLNWDGVGRARRATSGRALEGWALISNSDAFVEALHHPDRLSEVRDTAERNVELLRHTAFGRVQLAALRMLELERDEVPVERWWPQLEGDVASLEAADLSHFLPEFLAGESAIYQRYGLDAVNADRLAQHRFTGTHGPLVQYFVGHARRLAAARRAAGDEAGATSCEHLAQRLLRQFVLDSAPAGLRLLAADLLADQLDAAAAQATLVQKLRAWRQAYHVQTDATAPAPALLDLGDHPPPDDAAQTFARGLAATVWAVAGLPAVGIVALLFAAPWIRAAPPAHPKWRPWIQGMIATLLIIVIGWAVVSGLPRLVSDDLRRAAAGETEDVGLPRLPILAASVALLLTGTVAGIGQLQRPRKSWFARAGRSAAAIWLLLSAAALIHVGVLRRAQHAFASRPALSLTEQVRAIADPNADGLLDDLRVWEP